MISFRERRPWLVGLVSIALIAVGIGFAFSINRFEDLRGVYSISADLEDAAGLISGNEVRLAGVRVGRVIGVALTDESARIEMEIESDIRIPKETFLEVKLKTLLGQKFIDLQLPRDFIAAGSNGGDPEDTTAGFLEDGDVIPMDQTKVPFEIYQAATQGSAVLEEIDKRALRRMLVVLGDTVGASRGELRNALVSLDALGDVLGDKGPEIKELLRNLKNVSGTLAAGGQDFEEILARGAEVLGVLAERRETTSSLLAAIDDLSQNLGVLIQVARGSLQTGTRDLNGILISVEGELASIEQALQHLAVAQRMFGRPARFGRFVELHACAITTEDTCRPEGSPEQPGLPVKGTQPGSDPELTAAGGGR